MIALDPSNSEKDYSSILTRIAEAGAEVACGNLLLAPVKLYEAFNAYGTENLSIEQKAYRFWHTVFATAATDCLTRNRWALQTDQKKITEVLERLLRDSFRGCAEYQFAPDHLLNPVSLPLYRNTLREHFPQAVQEIEQGTQKSQDEIRLELDKCLRAAIWRVWNLDAGAFQEFEAKLTGLVAQGWTRQQAWLRHYAWLEEKLSGETLFGQDEGSGVTLRSVYTPLRCAYERYENLPGDDGEDTGEHRGEPHDGRNPKCKRTVHLNWLEAELTAWLKGLGDKKGADSLRVLTGGPGSGKTSVARVIAADIAQGADVHVCFVELQHFNMSGELRSSLTSHLERKRDGIGLGGDPLAWQDTGDDRPVLFVFDGLDELVRRDDLATDITRDFINKVHLFLKTENQGRFRVAALVTGRPAAAEPAFKAAHLDEHALLQVMPMNSLENHSFFEGLDPTEDGSQGAKELRAADHRPDFWETYCKAIHGNPKAKCGALEVKELNEFTCEPLLFYLLVLSGYAETGADAAAANKNLIYREIFRRVYKRDEKKRRERGYPKISKKHFFLLMECLGLAVWHGGGRTGADADFAAIREWHTGSQRRELAAMDTASLKNVAMQFYTRNESMSEEGGFQFIHKSFGEYLAACALVRIGVALAGSDDGDEEVAVKWLKRTGPAQVTHEIIGFLRGEMRQRTKEQLEEVLEPLTEQLNWAIENGMPAHGLKNVETWREAETRQRNAAGALLTVINGCVLAMTGPGDGQRGGDDPAKVLVPVRWPDIGAARRFLDMLHVSAEFNHPHGQVLSGLTFIDPGSEDRLNWRCDLTMMRLIEADLQGADLQGAYLQRADLQGADLQGADLQGADLQRADLQGADLQRADLQGADLQRADLQGADLQRAYLQGADLQGANLQGADLQRAYLQGAYLQGAYLQGADLQRADLQGADLQGADLQGANLQGADTSDAGLHIASLVSVDLMSTRKLSRAQINSAFGDAGTRLPETCLDEGGNEVPCLRPDHWAQTELDPIEAYRAWRTWIEERQAGDAK